MKKNRSTIILILIFLVGLSVMLHPTVSDYVNQRHQSRALASYDETVNEMSDADYTAYFEAADAYNQRLAATPNSFFTPEQVSGYDETLDVSGTGIMGYITIPRIGVELPVYHGTIDNIIGVVHEKDFYLGRLRKDTTLEDLVKPTLYTTGSTQISQLLRTLREQHHHMAVVVDEYGGTEGIITLEDILEEIVGNILDEYDEEDEMIQKQNDGSMIANGLTELEDLEDLIPVTFDKEDYETLNGFLIDELEHIPGEDEKCVVDYEGYRFTALQVDNNIIQTVKIEKLPEA